MTRTESSAERDLEELARYCRHDLLEPVRTISIGLDLLGESDVADQDRLVLRGAIATAGEQLESVAARLTSFFGLHGAAKAPADLSDLVETAWPGIGADHIELCVDAHLMCIAFTELFENSVRHNPATTISISVTARPGKDGTELIVCDDGRGFGDLDPTELTELLRHGPRGGPGVGLAMVRRIAELHGGSFAIANSGSGVAARLTLPH